MVLTPFITPGATDRNVAAAWATWLLREDDAPASMGDHLMDGLAGGGVLGCCFDIATALLRRAGIVNASRGAYGWTRVGASMGAFVGISSFAAKRIAARDTPREAKNASDDLVVRDPWAASTQTLQRERG